MWNRKLFVKFIFILSFLFFVFGQLQGVQAKMNIKKDLGVVLLLLGHFHHFFLALGGWPPFSLGVLFPQPGLQLAEVLVSVAIHDRLGGRTFEFQEFGSRTSFPAKDFNDKT